MVNRRTHLYIRKDLLTCVLVMNVGLYICLLYILKKNSFGNKENAEMLEHSKKIQKYHYLCPFFSGGIGNQMFEFAGVYGMAKQKGMEIGIYDTSEIFKIFSLKMEPIQNLSIFARAFTYMEKRACAFDNETTNFPSTRNVLHISYLQSWKYFANFEKDIREQFQFKQGIVTMAKSMIQKAIAFVNHPERQKVILIGVHVRRGDYVTPYNKHYGYRMATEIYINNALTFYRTKFIKPLFLVFTNEVNKDMTWCKTHITGNDVVYMFGDPRPREVDLCALSMCNHSIITVGSFGWWGAWLANGTVVYYKDFITPGSELRKQYSADFSDFIYPGWIGL